MVMRQQVWIDRHVQGVLVGRVLLYWSGILVYFGLSTICFHFWQNPEWTLGDYFWAILDQIGPSAPLLLLLLPLVIFDIVRLSNRFAGPIYRLRTHLNSLSQESNTAPLNFRDDDYWQTLADPINALQTRLLELEQQVQTLSFVHKNLTDPLPSEETIPVHVSALEELVRNGVASDTIVHEDPVHEESGDEDDAPLNTSLGAMSAVDQAAISSLAAAVAS